ncbi:MAG: putative prophage phiRv2 integrase [Pelotomaculum sp. PtaB.Bin104]|nr:MAG: putative prophage phiRv2 integrase [Pelotomaculum sp. PtaB.Bin104]
MTGREINRKKGRGFYRERPPGSGSWEIRVHAGNGKYFTETVKGNEKDAQIALTGLLHKLDIGSLNHPSRITLKEFLETWLKYVRKRVTVNTFRGYSVNVKNHICPIIGRIKLFDLKVLHLVKLYDVLDEEKNLSPATVHYVYRTLHAALNYAMECEYVNRNVSDLKAAKPPRPPKYKAQILDQEQVAILIDAAWGSRIFIPVVLAISTGMRRGEILGLKWSDIDFESGIAKVERQLVWNWEINALELKPPKSEDSIRTIALPPLAVEVLKKHRVMQKKEKLMVGGAYLDQRLICAQPDGKPWDPDAITKEFRSLVDELGLPRVRLHDLRHSHATILLEKGIQHKVVSERLGHSQINITLDLYSHVTPILQKEAAIKIDEVLSKSKKIRQGK